MAGFQMTLSSFRLNDGLPICPFHRRGIGTGQEPGRWCRCAARPAPPTAFLFSAPPPPLVRPAAVDARSARADRDQVPAE